jgi:hypothetical protein
MSNEPIEHQPAVDGSGGHRRGRSAINERQICKYQELTPLWAHADGNGFNIQLETVPLDGRVALRIATGKNK